ncbi:MAG: hypothetical protein ACLFVU_02145 [Phycisphaerae bacterium]
MSIYISKTIQDDHSIDQLVEHANEGLCEGMEGIEFSPEQLAGQYAWQAAKEADPDWIDEDSLGAHLEFLRDAGAKFDELEAIEHGLKLAAADSE